MSGGELIYRKKDVSYSESPKQDRTLDISWFFEGLDLQPYLIGFYIEDMDSSFIHDANFRYLKEKTNFSYDQSIIICDNLI
jgi:hypothetical protein